MNLQQLRRHPGEHAVTGQFFVLFRWDVVGADLFVGLRFAVSLSEEMEI